MFDKQESNMLFSGQRVNFSSLGPGMPHFQKTDIATSSYFIDMDIVDEISKKRKYMSLDNKDSPGYSPISCGSKQYYDNDNYTMGQEPEFDHINRVLLSNLRPTYLQQKEPSLFRETYKEEIANLRDVERIGLVKQLEQSGYQSECNYDLVSTFLHDEDEQQIDTIIPHFPVVLETPNSEKAFLGMENLQNNVFVSGGKQDTLTSGHKNQSLVESNLYVNATSNNERPTVIGDEISANMEEQNKPTNSRLSPVISEKIWDGSLKLNTSTTVSAVAFFKSGEKVQNLNWPDHIEIKGKVRLQAFEKFIQELPRSRTRALMVISLCWKLGSCERDLSAMMAVAKNYRESEKVGFAQIPPGIDLYVCPRSDTIITILAKYGFFKGMAAVEEDQDSLIGCVVWRRGQSSTNLVSKTPAEGKKPLVPEQPLKSAGPSIQELKSPAMETRVSEKKQVAPSETEKKESSNPPGSETPPSSTKSQNTTVQTLSSSIPYSCPLVPTQQKPCEGSSLNLLQENMKPAGISTLSEKSGEDKAVIVSESCTEFNSLHQMTPVVVQSLGMFGSISTAPALRPLIPVNSSNFQFLPPAVHNTHPSLLSNGNAGSDSSCTVKNPAQPALPGLPPLPTELRRLDLPGPPPLPTELRRPDQLPPLPTELRRPDNPGPPSLQTEVWRLDLPGPPPLPAELRQPALPGPPPLPVELRQPALPGPPPLPIEILQRFIQSKKNEPKDIINGKMLHMETKPPSFPRIVKSCRDIDDLPEFDFNSACEEQPDAPMSRLPGQQTHYPDAAPPLNKAFSFEAAKTESFEALQHTINKTSPLTGKPLTSNESFFLAQKFGDIVSVKTPSTERFQFKNSANDSRHCSVLKRKNMWDDDDDMPEWCPPDLEIPEIPPPTASENPRRLPALTPPPPSSSYPLPQSRDLQQVVSRHGLLGPFPSPDAHADGFVRPARSPPGSRRTDSVSPRAGKFKYNRRPPHYAAEHRRHRR